MTRHLSDRDLARMRMGGLSPLPTDRALQLLDTALLADRPVAVAAQLDTAALSGDADLPPLWRDLVTRTSRRVIDAADTGGAASEVVARLHSLAPEQRLSELTELICVSAATVLGHSSTIDIDDQKAFQELGFDSLTAVELRNRLKSATDLTLSPTLIFDYPTPAALAAYLSAQLAANAPVAAAPPNLLARFDDIGRELDTLLRRPDWTAEDKAHVTGRLHALIAELTATGDGGDEAAVPDDAPTDERSELLALLDEDLTP